MEKQLGVMYQFLWVNSYPVKYTCTIWYIVVCVEESRVTAHLIQVYIYIYIYIYVCVCVCVCVRVCLFSNECISLYIWIFRNIQQSLRR